VLSIANTNQNDVRNKFKGFGLLKGEDILTLNFLLKRNSRKTFGIYFLWINLFF
jgi:hypothetical protein